MDSDTPKTLTKNIIPDTQLGKWLTTILDTNEKGPSELKVAMRRLNLIASVSYYGKWSDDYYGVVWDKGFKSLGREMNSSDMLLRSDADFLEKAKILKIIRRSGHDKQQSVIILQIGKEEHRKSRPAVRKFMQA